MVKHDVNTWSGEEAVHRGGGVLYPWLLLRVGVVIRESAGSG